MCPSSFNPTFSEAGIFGKPGIVIISPVNATMNSAPADILTSVTGTMCPEGAPNALKKIGKRESQ